MKSVLNHLVNYTAPKVGAALARKAGVPEKYGTRAGQALAARLTRIIGSGDYETSPNTPVINSLFKGSRDLTGVTFGNAAIRLQFREYIGDVMSGSTANTFSSVTYPINPGSRSSFPYLGQLAANYEQYHFHGLVYEIVSTATPFNSTSSSLGTTIVTHMSNPDKASYSSKFEMENSENAVSARVDRNIIYGVECENFRTNGLAVRSGAISGGSLLMYDHGALVVGTATPLINAIVGELWVTYDVTLSHPRISNVGVGNARITATGSTNSTLFDTSIRIQADTTRVNFAALGGTLTFYGGMPNEYYYVVIKSTNGGTWASDSFVCANCTLTTLPSGIPYAAYTTTAPLLSRAFAVKLNGNVSNAVLPSIVFTQTSSTTASTSEILIFSMGSDTLI